MFKLLNTHPVFNDGFRVVTQQQLHGGRSEIGETQYGEVLVVEGGVVRHLKLHTPHHRENPRVALLVSVCCLWIFLFVCIFNLMIVPLNLLISDCMLLRAYGSKHLFLVFDLILYSFY